MQLKLGLAKGMQFFGEAVPTICFEQKFEYEKISTEKFAYQILDVYCMGVFL